MKGQDTVGKSSSSFCGGPHSFIVNKPRHLRATFHPIRMTVRAVLGAHPAFDRGNPGLRELKLFKLEEELRL